MPEAVVTSAGDGPARAPRALAAPHGQPAGWEAELDLRFDAARGRTRLASRAQSGPLCVQKPFYPSDGACHVYLLHPPGGLAGGDALRIRAVADAGSRVLLTTPASTKFYRSNGRQSLQSQSLNVAAGATFEWLPLDTILFGGSFAHIETSVALDAAARFIGWDVASLGRPLSGDHYDGGRLRQRLHVTIGGSPRLTEQLSWRAGDRVLTADWGLGGYTVWAALYAYPAGAELLGWVREYLARAPDTADSLTGATRLGDLLVVRCLARDPERVRRGFEALWEILRRDVIGTQPCRPRIWDT